MENFKARPLGIEMPESIFFFEYLFVYFRDTNTTKTLLAVWTLLGSKFKIRHLPKHQDHCFEKESRELQNERDCQATRRGRGGGLPYMGYIGTCHGIGYGF